MHKKRKFNTIVGINPSNLKKFILYEFGEPFFIKIKRNANNITYDVYLLDKVDNTPIDSDRVKKWNIHWGKHYRLMIIPKDLCSQINEMDNDFTPVKF